MTLTSVTCHDPHGSASYRNLRADPSGGAGSFPVTAAQTVLPDGSNPAQVYIPSNVFPKAGMSAWCGACHGQFHGRTSSEEGTGSPWFRHPQDQTISSAPHADYGFWSGTVANRVPVQSPSDNTVPSNDDQVFCLSCHRAHGSANRSALIFADGATPGSTCQQCHNK
jgi:predicted CXXCH cytochrome family protein